MFYRNRSMYRADFNTETISATYPAVSCTEIQVSLKIRVLPSRTLSISPSLADFPVFSPRHVDRRSSSHWVSNFVYKTLNWQWRRASRGSSATAETRYGFCTFCVGSRPSDHYFRSVCLSVCLCRVFLSRLRSDFDQTRTLVICPGLVVSPRI